jgi:hypothetical protein
MNRATSSHCWSSVAPFARFMGESTRLARASESLRGVAMKPEMIAGRLEAAKRGVEPAG